MNDIYEKIKESNEGQYSIYFIERKKENRTIKYNLIKSKRTIRMGKSLRENTIEATKNIISREIISYEDELSQKRGKIQTIESCKVPNYDSVINSCRSLNSNTINNLESLAKNLWGYIIRIDMGDVFIYIFKKYTPSCLVDTTKAYYLFNGGRMAPLKKKNTFSLDKYYDAIVMIYPGSKTTPIYITNRIEFEEFFGFKEHYIKFIRENKHILMNSGKIDSVDDFVERCSKNFMYSLRLSRIIKKGKINTMDMTEVERYLKNNNSEVKIDNGVIIYNKKQAEEILDILDDNYLYSKVTRTNYRSSGKIETN